MHDYQEFQGKIVKYVNLSIDHLNKEYEILKSILADEAISKFEYKKNSSRPRFNRLRYYHVREFWRLFSLLKISRGAKLVNKTSGDALRAPSDIQVGSSTHHDEIQIRMPPVFSLDTPLTYSVSDISRIQAEIFKEPPPSDPSSGYRWPQAVHKLDRRIMNVAESYLSKSNRVAIIDGLVPILEAWAIRYVDNIYSISPRPFEMSFEDSRIRSISLSGLSAMGEELELAIIAPVIAQLGLGAIDGKADRRADIEFLELLGRHVTAHGRIILVLPCGKSMTIHSLMRIYDQSDIEELFRSFRYKVIDENPLHEEDSVLRFGNVVMRTYELTKKKGALASR